MALLPSWALSILASLTRIALLDTGRSPLASCPSSALFRFMPAATRSPVSFPFSLGFSSKILPVVRSLAVFSAFSFPLANLFRLRWISAPIAEAKLQVLSLLRLWLRTTTFPVASAPEPSFASMSLSETLTATLAPTAVVDPVAYALAFVSFSDTSVAEMISEPLWISMSSGSSSPVSSGAVSSSFVFSESFFFLSVTFLAGSSSPPGTAVVFTVVPSATPA